MLFKQSSNHNRFPDGWLCSKYYYRDAVVNEFKRVISTLNVPILTIGDSGTLQDISIDGDVVAIEKYYGQCQDELFVWTNSKKIAMDITLKFIEP